MLFRPKHTAGAAPTEATDIMSAVRMRQVTADKADRVLRRLGLSPDQAITLFLRRVNQEQDLSFLQPGAQEKRIAQLEDQVDSLMSELSKRESAGKPTIPFDKLCDELGL
ncbi:MAG: hypothetical protein AAF471_09675 [Myxococcota bacterium]